MAEDIHTLPRTPSSAVDLTRSPTGLASSQPPSPEGRNTFARRRLSWGRVDPGNDPLRLDISPRFHYNLSDRNPSGISYADIDYPFPPVDEPPRLRETDFRNVNLSYDSDPDSNIYSAPQAGPSSASLVRSSSHGDREDDEARLTSNMAAHGMAEGWEDVDYERVAGDSPHVRRYEVPPSPLKQTTSMLKSVTRSIRRASLRVANVGGTSLENQMHRLDGEDDETPSDKETTRDGDVSEMSRDDLLRGRTLGFLGSSHWLRIKLFKLLLHPWTEPTILLLIIFNAVVLTIQASGNLVLTTPKPPRSKGYFNTWEDYVLFVLFILYTLEALARICVSGLILDPEVPLSVLLESSYPGLPNGSTVNINTNSTPQQPLQPVSPTQISDRIGRLFALPQKRRDIQPTIGRTWSEGSNQSRFFEKVPERGQYLHSYVRDLPPNHPSNLHRAGTAEYISLPFRLSINQEHDKIRRHMPYLRQSRCRMDFVAILGFWVMFVLATTGIERGAHHVGALRALSVLRITRLLTITSGTTTILHSLKVASPLLTKVAYFVVFAMVLFSIIGIQSFKGSFRRACYLTNDPDLPGLSQTCGGYIDPVAFKPVTYLSLAGDRSQSKPKGYICPLGQVCREKRNPRNNTQSFDTIYHSTLQVTIVASVNTWAPIMYSMVDSEFFVSCFFFIVCVIVLNFWLINLFVAVITNSFSAIRAQTKKSAFGAEPIAPVVDDPDDNYAVVDSRRSAKINYIKTVYQKTYWLWVFLALVSLGLQASRTEDMSAKHEWLLDKGELFITILFDVEIVLRILATLPNWRTFFHQFHNQFDLFLAFSTTIIQIPVIHRSNVYPWFTIFQLVRFYRVVLEVPRMRPLLLAVFGNMYGLVNMSLFLILINYIAALVAIQLLRGDVPGDVAQNFGQVYTSFLAIWQVFSSENWTDVLYVGMTSEIGLGQTIIVAIFITCWLLFANFIILQMFIAVINENFDVAEELKRSKQASHYLAAYQPETARFSWMRRLNPYRWLRPNPVTVRVENLPSNLVIRLQRSLVQDRTVPRPDTPSTSSNPSTTDGQRHPRDYSFRSFKTLQRFFAGETNFNDVPLSTIRHPRDESISATDPNDEETERHLELLAAINPDAPNEDVNEVLYERRAQKDDFMRDHPSYDMTFWIFSTENPLRKFCQSLVVPANGERIRGIPPSNIGHPIFQLLLLLAVIGGILVEGIATPKYRHDFYNARGFIRGAWFDIAEAALSITLFVEFMIKIVADGFMFTPHAYLRSIWNILDFIVLVGLVINLTTALIVVGGLSRLTRSLKALRALRLITLIDRMRYTFESLIISGINRIFEAAVLALLYMIPYAVWGLNIFSGLTNQCNDNQSASDCTNEYQNQVYFNAYSYPVPRVWANPSPSTTFSFDSFRSSLLILFEIVSLEGWIDVMNVMTSIVGPGLQPQTNHSQANSIFFLIYNLLGGVVILTVFVSIIIGNFRAKTGTAFMTQAQREWEDLQRLLKRQKPSKRPQEPPTSRLRAWCFRRAVEKNGIWAKIMTGLFVIHIIALMTQGFTTHPVFDKIRNAFFLAVTLIYILDVAIRFLGLGWRSFRANGWNRFDIIIAGGSFVTTLIVQSSEPGFVVQQLQKLFLVSIAFKLVQQTDSLNKLFKTAVASLPVIGNLLGLWIILFIFFAIAFMEVFGLTKWNSAETRTLNFSSMGRSLVALAFMSTGEGWNQYMHDHALSYPRCTDLDDFNHLFSDCGSGTWAFSLFIAWNILSMYIFVNMFTGVVVENFSYVFQASGGTQLITREGMRSFKKIWADFANPKTGYLERNRFVPFFAELSGVFEVRIYPEQYSIPNIKAAVRPGNANAMPRFTRDDSGIDLNKLHTLLGHLDYSNIRKRRLTYNRLYYEASITHEPGRGMSFTNMLIMLAHHKLIVDREALSLKDYIARLETNKRVADAVNMDRVRSLFKMIYLRRRFRAFREQQRRMDQEIPSIVVDALPATPPMSSRDITSGFDPITSEPSSPSLSDKRYQSPNPFSADFSIISGLQGNRHASEVSLLSADLGFRSSTFLDEDPQNALAALQNSLWGEMIQQAAEEEK